MPNLQTNGAAAPATTSVLSAVRTAGEFAAQVIVRADVSRKASKVAVDKLSNADAKEFAGYELLEAETVVSVLEQIGAVLPPMSAETKGALDQIVNAPAGRAFDVAYMTAEYENHAFLRDLAEAYLANSDATTRDPAEQEGRHLAQVAFFAFTEHTSICRRILKSVSV